MINMVSIIVPVYNVKEYLAECIDSICNQTLSEIEIILVDDGSTDGSAQLCDMYAQRDKRIQVLHQENGGSTKARNAGLNAAHGEYIGFVDSDDWIEPEMYEELLRQCTQNHADMAVCAKCANHRGYEYKEGLGLPEGLYVKNDPAKAIIRNLIYSQKDKSRGISPNLYDKLLKKELLCRHQFAVDERVKYGEDDICVYSCLLDAERVVFLDQAYYHYRQREGSICHTSDTRYFEQITWFYQQLREVFEQHSDAGILMEQLNLYMLEFTLRGMNKHFGFGYGVVVPYYLPPYEVTASNHIRKIVLYGAGRVGQDYFRSFQIWGNAEVILWVDKQHENYRKKGMPVESVSAIGNCRYDAVLIAILDSVLAEKIRAELMERGVAAEKIIYGKPRKFLEDIGRKQ